MADDLFNSFMNGPDEKGRFGDFGGRFVSETLMPLILELEAQYEHAKTDQSFWDEMEFLWKHYVGRPSPLYFAERLTEELGGAKIYLKRDELNHTGAHKINNVLGQIILARRMGKTRIIAETGAGQHGVATATVCAKFGLKCIVYMGAHDVERQAPNVFRMKLLGAEVVPVTSGRGTLKDAMNDALRDWVTNVRDTFYCIGTVAGPHPYPAMVRDFQAIIGKEAKEQMKLEFQSIAHKLFEDKSEKFTQQNKSNMGEILNPLKDQLSEFKKKGEDVYDKESRDRVSLLQEIVSLKELNTRMSADALNLTKALKGDSKAQGNWGEMVLEKVLEASGLQKGREYETQGSFSNEDGQRLRPDVVVHLPENKHVVIDSKVSLTAWERFSSETEEQQELQLRAHIESIRAHIKDLSAKNYQDLYGINTPDYVLMFIPIEPAFLKALETDARLFGDAFDKNIMLVCPSTLLVTLKTIHNIWRFEYQNRNALEIARQAGALHDQFVLFAEALEDIGDKLDKAQRAYETAHKRLSSGKGNLVGRIQRLETLGAKARKSIPETLRLDSEEEEEV